MVRKLTDQFIRKADIALIGLAVMGQNLILNMDSKGFVVCAYNRTVDKVRFATEVMTWRLIVNGN